MNKKYEIDEMRRWTREELGAIVGPPVNLSPVVAAALLGRTTAEIRALARREILLSRTDERGRLRIPTFNLLVVGQDLRSRPRMLRAGTLVERPRLPADELARRFPTGDMTVPDVVAITGQTVEEVEVDLLARRLEGQRGFRPRWRIFAYQFGEEYDGGRSF